MRDKKSEQLAVGGCFGVKLISVIVNSLAVRLNTKEQR